MEIKNLLYNGGSIFRTILRVNAIFRREIKNDRIFKRHVIQKHGKDSFPIHGISQGF